MNKFKNKHKNNKYKNNKYKNNKYKNNKYKTNKYKTNKYKTNKYKTNKYKTKNKITGRLLDWIYPRRCAFCDGLLGRGESGLCSRCKAQVPSPIPEPRCKKCGKALRVQEQEYCYDCSQSPGAFDRGMGVFTYEDPLKQSLMRFKYKGRKEYGLVLGKLMCLYGERFLKEVHPQVIIPVPIHSKKLQIRGYNQAEVLAQVVSSGFSIPIRTDLVLRKKFTKAQKELSREERRKNLRRAFCVRPEAARYTAVLLIDDIYTTGSTVSAIAEKLKERGVKRVYFLALCIGKGF